MFTTKLTSNRAKFTVPISDKYLLIKFTVALVKARQGRRIVLKYLLVPVPSDVLSSVYYTSRSEFRGCCIILLRKITITNVLSIVYSTIRSKSRGCHINQLRRA